MPEGIFAQLSTTRGDITVALEYEKVPMTVANFVALAEGNQENQARPLGQPYYDGMKFHRVIANFMIQGGDPSGSGAGGPGYQFPDEFHQDLRHDQAGVMSMANAGPGTNGSQFFITHAATPWLDDKHSIFGRVIEGLATVDEVQQGDRIERVEIIRKGSKAQAWDAPAVFQDYLSKQDKLAQEAQAREEAKLAELVAGFEKTASGLYYKINTSGSGASAQKGKTLAVHYRGSLVDGSVFDDSRQRGEALSLRLGEGRVIAGWEEGLAHLRQGDQATLVIPPTLGYGASGAGGVIPPHAWLVFELELVEVS